MELQELRFGVEMETIRRRRGEVAKAIQSVVGGEINHLARPSTYDPWEVKDDRERVWRVVADASLTSVAPDLRAEVVSPVLCYEDLGTVQEVVRAIRKCGATVDDKCGMHIHVDASAFDGRTLANLAKIVNKQEELILTALGVSDARLRQYTKPMDADFIAKIERNRPKTKDEMNRIWYGLCGVPHNPYYVARRIMLRMVGIHAEQLRIAPHNNPAMNTRFGNGASD